MIDGYSAENVFGHARSRLEPQSIQHFWESGFWNDFFDPNKTFLSSFDTNFKRPVDPVHGDVHEDFGQPVERQSKAVKLTATFMDHVRDANIMNWKDERDAEWQTAIFRWHSMLGTWSTDVQVVLQILAEKVSRNKRRFWLTSFTTRLHQQF